jgi:hypothetical protein
LAVGVATARAFDSLVVDHWVGEENEGRKKLKKKKAGRGAEEGVGRPTASRAHQGEEAAGKHGTLPYK